MFLNFLTLSVFFLLSKEVLFYGEERLIVLSYLTLFVSLFFVLGGSMSSGFSERAAVLKSEFDSFFSSILVILHQTRVLIKNFAFFNYKIIKLFLSIYAELVFYFSVIANFSSLKFNFFKLKFNNFLNVSVNFVNSVMHLSNNIFFVNYLSKVISWKILNNVNWVRTVVPTLSNSTTSISNNKTNKNWFISLNNGFNVSGNYKFTYNVNKLNK